ncbi:Teneurin-2, partial [Plecturocebus cupreus]
MEASPYLYRRVSLIARLECSGAIPAHCNFRFPVSSNSRLSLPSSWDYRHDHHVRNFCTLVETGFTVGQDAACPVLCSGNGQYSKGTCQCYSGWKGAECDVPMNQCIDPSCGGHGSCIDGNCVCSAGYKGEHCEEVTYWMYIYSIKMAKQSDSETGKNHDDWTLTINSSDWLVEVDCLDPTCSSHGVCVNGECLCSPGWGGLNCELARVQCPDQCSGHGTYLPDTGLCSCDPNWMGPDCSV